MTPHLATLSGRCLHRLPIIGRWIILKCPRPSRLAVSWNPGYYDCENQIHVAIIVRRTRFVLLARNEAVNYSSRVLSYHNLIGRSQKPRESSHRYKTVLLALFFHSLFPDLPYSRSPGLPLPMSVKEEILDPTPTFPVQHSDVIDHGARTVEATHKVYGKYSRWALFIGLGLAAYIYSLDGQTTYTYLIFAASSLGDHSLISSVQVAQAVIIAVFKPIVAKFADITSRGTAYFVVCMYTLPLYSPII